MLPLSTMENGRDFGDAPQKKGMNSLLLSLPDDVIYSILNACDIASLATLCRVCQKLNYLINQQCVWVWKMKSFTVLHDLRSSQRERWEEKMTAKDQCRIANNWRRGKFKDSRILFHRVLQMPYISLNEDGLWVSYKNLVKCYKIRRGGRLQEMGGRTLRGHTGDITRYRCHGKITVTVSRDGSMYCFNNETAKDLWHLNDCHTSDIHDVDFYQNIVVTGSRDATVKMWTAVNDDNGYYHGELINTLELQDRVWSLAVNPAGHSFATGTAGLNYIPPLRLWDFNGSLIANLGGPYRNGAGVLDILYENPHILFSCGYDTYVRMWDLRVSPNKWVKRWEEPFDSTLYCIRTDGEYSLLTGTATYGMTRLWDKRMTKPVQVYYSGRNSSPVYSLAFDSSHLYVALDRGINMLDFNIK